MPQYLKDYGERLVQLGYTVLPIAPGTKRPDLRGWPLHVTTEEDVRKWHSNGRAKHGAGINARNTPAIDVDVLDKDVADAMSDEIDKIFPNVSLLTRTGQAPKFLIPFRSDDPFRKMTSGVYTDGTNDHKVEILGDGQQWVAYHIHPNTDRPYEWWDGVDAAGLIGVDRTELPRLNRSDAQLVIDAFEVLAARQVAAGDWSRKSTTQERNDPPISGDDFSSHVEPVKDLTIQQIEALVHKLDCDDRDAWVRAGRILHHQFGGGENGFDVWNDWSMLSVKWDCVNQREVWDSFGNRPDAPETIRSLMKEFGQPEKEKPEHKPRAKSDNPFRVHEWSDYKQNYLDTPWIIKGVLPQAEVGILYGPSGSGKTFFVLDLAATVARGSPWRGKKVSECRVVYVAAEAREGIKKRMDAYDQHVCSEGVRPAIIASAPNLLSNDVEALAKAIGKAGLIILDTMAASHSGDENSAKDMGAFLNACKDLSLATGAMVLAVHHTGKEESKGMRGSSALFAGADFVMEVFKNKKEHGAILSKSRDDASGITFGFALKRVVVGQDVDGEEVTTCVVEPLDKEVTKAVKRPKKLDNEEDSRYDMHREMLKIFEKLADNSPTGIVAEVDVLDAVLEKFPDKLRKNMTPVWLRLIELGGVEQTLGGYRVPEDDLSFG